MKLPGRSRDLYADDAAVEWASLRFDPLLQPLAAWVGGLIRDIAGVEWSPIEPAAAFTRDLRKPPGNW